MENQATKKKSPIRWIILTIAVLAGGGYAIHMINYNHHFETTDNAQVETHTSPVLARVAGYLQAVQVADYAEVHKNDTIAVIDDAEYRIAVQQSEADYSQAQADLDQAQADLAAAQADLRNAQVGLENAGLNTDAVSANADVILVRRNKAFQDYQRDQALLAEKAITQRQLDDSKARYDELVKQYDAAIDQTTFTKGATKTANVQIDRARAQIQRINAQLKRAEANLAVRKAQLDQANLRLSYTRIPAPIDGKIGRKNIEPGQYVQPGQTLCTVVNDETFWIVANFKETQISHIAEGQPVKITLDAYPKADIHGKVASLSEATGAKFSLLPPDNASGNFIKITQRVPIKITIDDPDKYKDLLRAGLSAEVEVRVKD